MKAISRLVGEKNAGDTHHLRDSQYVIVGKQSRKGLIESSLEKLIYSHHRPLSLIKNNRYLPECGSPNSNKGESKSDEIQSTLSFWPARGP